MACYAIAFQIYAVLLLLYVSDLARLYLYIVDLGALCSSKLSFLSHPPLFLSVPIILNLSDSFPFLCALLCAASLPTARRSISHCVLSPSKCAKALRRSPSLQKQLSWCSHAVTTRFTTNAARSCGTSTLAVTVGAVRSMSWKTKIYNAPTKDECCYLVATVLLTCLLYDTWIAVLLTCLATIQIQVQIWRYKRPTCISRKDLCEWMIGKEVWPTANSWLLIDTIAWQLMNHVGAW